VVGRDALAAGALAERREPTTLDTKRPAWRTENSMNPKPRPNHALTISILRSMSPEAKLLKAFELSEFSRALFVHGLRKRFPDLSEEGFRKLLLERLSLCHNRRS
jgi:hypothetical protein